MKAAFTCLLKSRSMRFANRVFVGALVPALAVLAVSGLEWRYLLGALLAFGLAGAARQWLKPPLEPLEKAAKEWAAGRYDHQLELDPELAPVARDLNRLAGLLAQSEETRQRWLTDTSHELRTPLAVLQAEIEAMQDGVRAADDKNLALLHSEVRALSDLVDRLAQLARSDSSHLTVVDLGGLLEEVEQSFADRFHQQGVSISGSCPDQIFLEGDLVRLRQLFVNLMENSCRYTSRGGQLRWSVEADDKKAHICFEDSEPGVPEDHYAKLFDRFFRVEQSRSRDLGGSGLGLSICLGVVEAHHGTIQASPSKLGGLQVDIELPLSPPHGLLKG